MSLGHLFKYAMSLKPSAAIRGGWRFTRRSVTGFIYSRAKYRTCSFVNKESRRQPVSIFHQSDSILKSSKNHNIDTKAISEHRFDLLGSGSVVIKYGMTPKGFDGHIYSAAEIETGPNTLVERLNTGNQERAHLIRNQISSQYNPIDWQLDFKSGYRWSERVASASVKYGHAPGVDIKIPWELARLQHLPRLAIANLKHQSEQHSIEFENQILDFISANPPGWGVNWLCSMDVSIRAANMILAYELFDIQPCSFTDQFDQEFTASIRAHGRHVAENLEWDSGERGNHYLANIAGLAFIARFLDSDQETNGWLAFSIQELIKETEFQFLDDGSNFEGSTSYHRLSAEIVTYATALIIGLPPERQQSLQTAKNLTWSYKPMLSSLPDSWHDDFGPFPLQHFQRLLKMATFSICATKPNGAIVQIGDNDSGRFFNFDNDDGSLNHQNLITVISGLIGNLDLSDSVRETSPIEIAIVQSLSGKTPLPINSEINQIEIVNTSPENSVAPQASEITIALPDVSITDAIKIHSFPGFGIYIWRTERMFLSVRCGPIGQNGRGGHAHNDQLAIELQIDGEDWVSDPGSFIYTADPKIRDAYRSIFAHAAPRFGDTEPSDLNLGLFRLENNANAKTLQFDASSFHGVHTAYGKPVFRQIKIGDGKIVLTDGFGGEHPGSTEPDRKIVMSGAELRKIFDLTLPFSRGYGRR
jgi:hypothetical protein